jgi:O-antigen ligase
MDRAGSSMMAPDTAVADTGEGSRARRRRRSGARHVVEICFICLYFALVLVAAIPMGANRDWAWAPIVSLLGGLAVWHALGLGISDGHVLRAAEMRPLMALVCCFLVVLGVGVVQLSPLVPPSWPSGLYARASEVLGHPVAAIVSVNADATRAILMKVAACGIVFFIARAVGRDAHRVRLFLLLFLASAVVVTAYGLLMQATNGSCYVFSYSKRPDLAPPGHQYICALSGTFVNSNSYAAYAGMALVVALGLTFSRSSASSERVEADLLQSGLSAWFTGARVIYLAMALLLFGGLLMSGSRGGLGATVLGALLLAGLLLRGRPPSRPVAAWTLVAAILIGAVFAVIAGSAFFTKIAKAPEYDLLGRFRLWQLAVSAIAQSPWLGWGLGSFPDVYAMMQPPDLQVGNDKAHSTPLEWIMDLGIPAALFAFATVLIPLGVCLSGCWRRRTDRYLPAVAFAATMVPILHSIIDFSLQMPSIGFVVSALLGMGWAQAFRRYE